MTRNIIRLFVSAIALSAITAASHAADPIVGNWKRPNGVIVAFTPCGNGFCASPITGPNAGKDAGKLNATGNGKYKGSLTDLESGKTYTGKGSIKDDTLSIAGCVLAVLCKSENWVRQ